MKKLSILVLLFVSSLIWAQPMNFKQLGHSLANYQVCSDIALSIADQKMNSYYQKMFNDAQLELLSISNNKTKIVYSTWDKSEKVLLNIDANSLQKSCLGRFEPLSRKMTKHPTVVN